MNACLHDETAILTKRKQKSPHKLEVVAENENEQEIRKQR